MMFSWILISSTAFCLLASATAWEEINIEILKMRMGDSKWRRWIAVALFFWLGLWDNAEKKHSYQEGIWRWTGNKFLALSPEFTVLEPIEMRKIKKNLHTARTRAHWSRMGKETTEVVREISKFPPHRSFSYIFDFSPKYVSLMLLVPSLNTPKNTKISDHTKISTISWGVRFS